MSIGSGPPQSEQIRLRLTKTQASLIGKGLAFLAKEDAVWREQKSVIFQYPFRLYPPPQGFDRGKRETDFMDKVFQLEQTIRPKARRGRTCLTRCN
jgi:hypothetical protein